MYQLLLENGQKIGQYNPNVSPAQTAKKIAKVLYETEQMEGKQKFRFRFVKNRTKAEGGDKEYFFEAMVTPLSRREKNMIQINGRMFLKKYDITVSNLNRA